MMQPRLLHGDGQVVCGELAIANTAPTRMRGLLGRRSLDSDEGLLLSPAGSVHTAFMRFPIDVVFLDRSLQVLDVRPDLGPWRMARARGAKAVVELPSGEAARRGIAPGVKLSVDAADDTAQARELVGPGELLLGALGAAAAVAHFGLTDRGLVTACLLAALGVLAVIDYRRHLLPNRIVLPSAALVLGLQLVLFPDQALEWTLASLGCAVALLVLTLAKPGGIGMGDVKLGLLLGAGLGADVAMALLLGFLALWPVAIYVVLTNGPAGRKRTLPLGPALALGAALVVLAG
jgi:uncharacterized membrane protein (UPF0127 family)